MSAAEEIRGLRREIEALRREVAALKRAAPYVPYKPYELRATYPYMAW